MVRKYFMILAIAIIVILIGYTTTLALLDIQEEEQEVVCSVVDGIVFTELKESKVDFRTYEPPVPLLIDDWPFPEVTIDDEYDALRIAKGFLEYGRETAYELAQIKHYAREDIWIFVYGVPELEGGNMYVSVEGRNGALLKGWVE